MFEAQTQGLGQIGADESYLDGAQVVIGVADEFGTVIGWFGRNYHPNEDIADEIGSDDWAPQGLQLVMGFADADEEHIIGWSIGKFLKKVTKAVASPITAPIAAVKAIAQGKPVFKAVAKSVVAPVTSSLRLASAVTKPVTTLASKPVGFVFGKKVGKAVAKAGTMPFSVPGKTLTALSQGKVGTALKTSVVDPLKTAGTIVRPAFSTASAIVRPVLGKKVATGLTSVSMMPFSTGTTVASQLAKGKVAEALKSSVIQPLKSTVPLMKAAQPILKSPVTAAIVSGVALAFPPVGVPLAAGYAAARFAMPYAATALSAADKVLAAAKGTLPAQKQAPASVAWALQQAAKMTIGKTYQAATLGSQDAQRGLAVLVAAKKVQAAIPAAQAAISPLATFQTGAVEQAPLVERTGNVIRGQWQKVVDGGTHDGPIVLKDGTIIRGAWNMVG